MFHFWQDEMARALPPLNWFRAFESAARNLSFTAAASELGLTQSAISQQVIALETRFSCKLFERKNRGLMLTDEGRRLVPMVAQAIATLRSASESFEIETEKKTLAVATSVSIAQWYLVPRLHTFLSMSPDIAVRLMTKVWPDEFSDAGVDVEIRFDSIKSAKRQSALLGASKSVIVCSGKLIKGQRRGSFNVEKLSDYPLIQVVGTSDTWQAWAQSNATQFSVNPTIFVDSHGMAVDFAKNGAGIALTSSTVAAPLLKEGTLVQLPMPALEAKDGYHMSILSGDKAPQAHKFADWLKEEVRRAELDVPVV